MSVYAVTNPATGEQVKIFPTFTDDELDSAIALAYDTYQNWLRSSTVEERAKLFPIYEQFMGERWFVIPNPMYGSWERAIGPDVETKLKALRR